MTAKEYLSQYYWTQKRIESLKDELIQLEAAAEYVSPRAETGGSGMTDKVGSLAAKIADKKLKIYWLIESSIDLKAEIKAKIDRVEDQRYRYILTERYILCRKWEDIAAFLNYSVRQVHRLHGRALQKLSLNVTIDV